MKKSLFSLVIILCALASFTLSACGNDNDLSIANGSIEINGKTYPVTSELAIEGSMWNNEGMFTLTALETIGGVETAEYSSFYFVSDHKPKVGDNFAKMSLTAEPMNLRETYDYVSGAANVISVDESKSTFVVKFINLKMSNGQSTYTYNGTAPIAFNFYE